MYVDVKNSRQAFDRALERGRVLFHSDHQENAVAVTRLFPEADTHVILLPHTLGRDREQYGLGLPDDVADQYAPALYAALLEAADNRAATREIA